MNPLLVTLGLALAATAATAQPRFSAHDAFYEHIARSEQWARPLQARQVPEATPADRAVRLRSLDAAWGQVLLRRDAVVINGRAIGWSTARRLLARPGAVPNAAVRIDIESVRLFEAPGRHLCVESSTGRSAGGSRWQQVVLVERLRARPGARLLAWTSPYASCEAVFADAGARMWFGHFDVRYESEAAIASGDFVLRSIDGAGEHHRYTLHFPDPANAFVFDALRQ